MVGPQFGVLIPTYRRNDKTFSQVIQTLRSVQAQTYDRWQVFLVGDCYADQDEFAKLAELLPGTWARNLPEPGERGRWSGEALWQCGGVTALNYGLAEMRRQGVTHVARLDHDDLWQPSHLACLARAYASHPRVIAAYTRALTQPYGLLPPEEFSQLPLELPLRAGYQAHSAVSWDLRHVPYDYRITPECQPEPLPADADLLGRVQRWAGETGCRVVYVPETTVRHLETGFAS